MITAVDSSVLLNVLTDDPLRGPASVRALDDARRLGRVVICPIVWAEVGACFSHIDEMRHALTDTAIHFDPFDEPSAILAARQWRYYRQRGDRRTRMIADFFLGAHALARAQALLTRDRGFYRRCFEPLRVLEPEPSP